MSKKSMIVAGVIVALIALVVVATQLKPDDTSSTANNDKGDANTTSTGIANGGNGSTTSTSSASSDTTAAGGGTNPAALTRLKPFEKVTVPNTPAKKVTSPVADGVTLGPLSEAPADTISGLKIGRVPDGSRYRIEMRPLGIGPDIVLGSRIAARVESATPVAEAPELKQIVNANMLVLMDTGHDGTVTKGGTYFANLTFRSDGSMMLPIISDVEPKK